MILKNIPLKKHCNYQIGGIADFYVVINSKEELLEVLSFWREKDKEMNNIIILGEGTNILFSDDGFKGLVIKNNISFIKREEESINVGSGTKMENLVSYYTQNSLSGLEWAGGLPGSVGGAVRGNAGAFGSETKDCVLEVESIDLKTLETKKRNNKECKFSYRDSIFKSGDGKRELILSAKFVFRKGEKEKIKSLTQEKIDYRIDRHPLEYPSLGSTFKNIDLKKAPSKVIDEFKANIKKDPFPVIPVAKLIIGAGLVGEKVGGAQISTKHPNYIVNLDGARAADVKELILLAKRKVMDKYQVVLEEEITYY